jgi:hypothetical protein
MKDFSMADEAAPPKFLSLEFHTHFFPRLFWDGLQSKKKAKSTFVSSAFMEGTIGITICLVLVALGAPSAVARGSIPGWIMTILGFGGIIFLVGTSVYFQGGTRPSYDNFQIGIFSFFVMLGLASGIYAGISHHALLIGTVMGAMGFIAGYGAGIFFGLWMQRLGWIVVVVNMVAGFAAIVLAVAAVIIVCL